MKFNLKLHECCAVEELRPAMNHVFFNKEWVVATTGHILAVVNINDLILEDFEKKIFMTYENKFLHRKAFQKIFNKEVIPVENGFECPSEFITVKFSDQPLTFPKWQSVIGDFKDKRAENVLAVNSKMLYSLCNSLPGCKNIGQTVLYITNNIKGITVFSKTPNKSYGLLMPVEPPEINPKLDRETMLFSFE